MGRRSTASHPTKTSYAARCGLVLQPSAFKNMSKNHVACKGAMKDGKVRKIQYGSMSKLLAAGAMQHLAMKLLQGAQENCVSSKRGMVTNHDVCAARDFDLHMSAAFCHSAVATCRDVPVPGEVCLIESEAKERKKRFLATKKKREEKKASA